MIDNTLRTAKIKMAYLLVLTIAGVLTAYYFIEYNRQYVKDLVMIIVFILISAYFFMLILKLDYFNISATGNNIKVRYYTAHPLFRKYKVFEIPKVAFTGYTIEKSFFGLKRDIKFVAKAKGKTFNFPAVSLSLLSKSKIEMLTFLLDDILKKNESVQKVGGF